MWGLQAFSTVNVGITTESPKKIQIPETNIWWYFEGIFFEGGIENHQKKEKITKQMDGWNIILSFWQSALFSGVKFTVRFRECCLPLLLSIEILVVSVGILKFQGVMEESPKITG